MKNPKILIYDGSFNGFLTTIFKIFEEKIDVANIQKNQVSQKGLFSEVINVFTQMDKARRVWNSIQNKSTIAIKTIYFAFLSETKGMEFFLYQYIQSMYTPTHENTLVGIADITLKIQQYSSMVAREKHRIEASTTFTISEDHIHFAVVTPGFDVLPLVSKHFRSKFKHKEFIVYDQKRKYAIYYNTETVEMISMELLPYHFQEGIANTTLKTLINNKLHTQFPKKPTLAYPKERAVV